MQLEHKAEMARLEERRRMDQLEIEYLKKQQEEATKLAVERKRMEDQAAREKETMQE